VMPKMAPHELRMMFSSVKDTTITTDRKGERTGTTMTLPTSAGQGSVGMVLGIEVSGLACGNADWYQLLDLCALTDTLIADEEGVYHRVDFNDRLVLGLKGTMSELLIRAVIDYIVLTVHAGERVVELRTIWQGGASNQLSMAMRCSPPHHCGGPSRWCGGWPNTTTTRRSLLLSKQRRRTATGERLTPTAPWHIWIDQHFQNLLRPEAPRSGSL
jgi:hypothetical protein